MKGYIVRQMLADKKIKVNDIARDLGVSHVAVSKVIHGRAKSARVQTAVAAAIGLPVNQVFPVAKEEA